MTGSKHVKRGVTAGVRKQLTAAATIGFRLLILHVPPFLSHAIEPDFQTKHGGRDHKKVADMEAHLAQTRMTFRGQLSTPKTKDLVVSTAQFLQQRPKKVHAEPAFQSLSLVFQTNVFVILSIELYSTVLSDPGFPPLSL